MPQHKHASDQNQTAQQEGPAWRVLRGTNFRDGRRVDAGSTVYKVPPDEAFMLEAKGALIKTREG